MDAQELITFREKILAELNQVECTIQTIRQSVLKVTYPPELPYAEDQIDRYCHEYIQFGKSKIAAIKHYRTIWDTDLVSAKRAIDTRIRTLLGYTQSVPFCFVPNYTRFAHDGMLWEKQPAGDSYERFPYQSRGFRFDPNEIVYLKDRSVESEYPNH